MLLRFSDILRSRIETLTSGFRDAMKEFAYDGGYTLVYPVKVNQQRHVVEEIVQFGKPMGVGLECGSKPELQVVLAMSEDTSHTIVCNGYKDEEFMRLALHGAEARPPGVHRHRADDGARGAAPGREGDGRAPDRRRADQARVGGLRALGGERRREVQVRPERERAREGDRAPPRRRLARLPQADPLPSRLADHRHPVHQDGTAGGRALLRGDARRGGEHHARGRRRRARHRLRRLVVHGDGER